MTWSCYKKAAKCTLKWIRVKISDACTLSDKSTKTSTKSFTNCNNLFCLAKVVSTKIQWKTKEEKESSLATEVSAFNKPLLTSTSF